MTSGLFISFEGGDGAGKSTQLARLGDWIEQATTREVVRTREPGGTAVGRTLREVLLHGQDLGPRAEALLFAADRAHHVDSLIRPALERGAVVLTDRYLDSSVAYQAGGRTLPPQEVEHLSLWATEHLLPRVTVLLDLDPVHLAARVAVDPDRLEREELEFHVRTRQAFLDRAAAEPRRWLVVDAARPKDDIAEEIRDHVAPLMEAAR
ncbi:dTMP kinase [Ruania halotolerans]|uniref:dTMP kinase n=1 Tax=Ruania halotolerans TaxID=2897773 RepID=UPI001E3A6AB9|nr:dTMP kinase [Ruania halotolerans]UFU07152.1 dTMP kinase [Ruania halotolerans]